MAKKEGHNVTPGQVDNDYDFFQEFMPDGDSGLLVQDENPPEDEDKPEDNPDIDNKDDDKGEDKGDKKDEEGDELPPDSDDDYIDEGKDPEPDDKGDDDDDDEGEEPSSELVNTMHDFMNAGVFEETEKEYDPSEEGFKEILEDTVRIRVERELEKEREAVPEKAKAAADFFRENPEATMDDWVAEMDEFDYNTVDEKDPEVAIHLLVDYHRLHGYTDEEIRDTINDYKKAGSIARHSEKAKKFLVKNQEKEAQAKVDARKAAESKRIEKIESDRRDQEQTILRKKTIGGIAVSPEERQKVADYMLKPVKDGRTQQELDLAENKEAKLLAAYIQMNKIDLKKLEVKAETKSALKFRAKINKHTDKLAKGNGKTKKEATIAKPDDLSGLDSWSM